MKQLPEEIFKPNGHLTSGIQEILHLVFGFNKKALAKTIYYPGNFKFGAITLFHKIKFDKSFFTKYSTEQWFILVVHEQVHREDIWNHPAKGLGFYTSYLWQWMKVGFNYRKNIYEQKAYGIEPKAKALWRFEKQALLKLLQSKEPSAGIKDLARRFNTSLDPR